MTSSELLGIKVAQWLANGAKATTGFIGDMGARAGQATSGIQPLNWANKVRSGIEGAADWAGRATSDIGGREMAAAHRVTTAAGSAARELGRRVARQADTTSPRNVLQTLTVPHLAMRRWPDIARLQIQGVQDAASGLGRLTAGIPTRAATGGVTAGAMLSTPASRAVTAPVQSQSQSLAAQLARQSTISAGRLGARVRGSAHASMPAALKDDAYRYLGPGWQPGGQFMPTGDGDGAYAFLQGKPGESMDGVPGATMARMYQGQR